jgi:holo-[acyl-carrier protein] synthase
MSAVLPLKMTSIAADAARLLQQSVPNNNGPIRVGVDVVSISEFGATMATTGGAAFVRTRFTEAERAYCDERPERLAARWAAKEAVAKAIGTGFRGLRPSQIEIVHQPWGEPTVNGSGDRPWPDGADRWQWSLSIAHEGDAAVAVALAVVDTTPLRNGREHISFAETRAENGDPEHMPLDKEGGHS